MTFKKVAASALALAMLAGCSSSSSTGGTSTGRQARGESGSTEIDTLKLQFVPSRPADEIITATSNLGNLLIEAMADEGYTIGNVEITVSDSYEAAGEALDAGSVDIAWLPGGTYALYSDTCDVVLTATRNGLSVDSSNPADWNGSEVLRDGPAVTYYKGLIYAGPSEYGQQLAAKVNGGEELTWEDLANANWAVRDVTSSAGYIYPTMWLKANFGHEIADIGKDGTTGSVTTLDYASEFMQAAAGKIDVIVCYADGRNDYEGQWMSEWGRTDEIWNELNVIGVTENIYNDTVSVTMANPDIYNEAFISAFQNAMIAVASTDEGKDIISIYSHSGYQVSTDDQYDASREALTYLE